MAELINHEGDVWLAVMPVDCRRGINGLSALAEQLGLVPCSGCVLVFRNASGNRIKVLRWDGNGVWLWQRRLHQGHFVWPKANVAVVAITIAQWQWLVMGIDWQRVNATLDPFLSP